ncbi:MAG TPA: prolyl oligopeptidase family serine peptidase [Acidimicrobiales bacterium]|nr:prolyl oligopeptidase family serine peptidase [Acidimicrobiales bacterium]
MPSPKVVYPPARRADVVDDYHGTKVPDPYRWMEERDDNPELDAWLAAQDALCQPWLAALPGRDKWRAAQARLLPGTIGPPAVRGERLYFSRREPGEQHAKLFLREPDGSERVLFDPMAEDASGLTTLDVVSVSPDGDRIVIGVSSGGDEDTAIRVLDVATLAVVDGPIERTRYTSVAWLPDGSGFFYVRRLTPEPFNRRVWRHVVGASADDDQLVFGEGRDPSTYYSVDLSNDGRWLLIAASIGTEPRNDLYIADLAGDASVRPVVEGVDAETYGSVILGRLYLHTSLDAPKKRMVVTDPTRPGPENWTDVVPESDGVLVTAEPTEGGIVVAREQHAVTTLAVRDPATGDERAVALPGAGTAMVMAQRDHSANAWIHYTDFVNAGTVLHLAVDTATATTWATTPGALPPSSDVLVRQHTYQSHDGVDVRMFVIAKGDASVGPRPTILYGYGGFNISLSPAYSSLIQTWVDAGGVYAYANLRGGSEEGEEWHRAGMRENKQNVFEDFIAAARYLKAEGWTTTGQLGIYGGSNGGLLVGATLTQWPDEMSAVICSAPLLDMLRYEHFGLGITWNDEYGTADDPVEFQWLYGFSPYHKVRAGVAYPSVLFTSFDNDSRTDVMHPRKMCAALQFATSSDPDAKPILFRREADVGHSVRSTERTLDLGADQLSYFAHQLGLAPPR